MTTTQLSEHLHASDNPEYVRTPSVDYVAVLGDGAPGSDEFYRKKVLVSDIARILNGSDETPVVELQFWYPEDSTPVEIADFYSVNPIPSLLYRVLAQIPEGKTEADIADARTRAASVADNTSDDISLFSVPSQEVVQVMHHGPFSEEFATLKRLGDYAQERGLHRAGPHHEIHTDGFTRTTSQATLRTILRDPVA
ncbi:GyrI-like domain-containing protein [Microbacterium oryzae]|uniref:GyrI-like domain-containing protein n=1 Tax=Microbacterium oryzae TaxID=743009 RepID=UPI0025B019C9|nr:GyrI-like domain-containing protein [Microbacterium oryzae]MDN3310313.1 GyrI-like domain-containing protein [Microbacterium oryzae]